MTNEYIKRSVISVDTVHTAFGNRTYYWCDTIEDMCRINAKLGDYANVRGTVYMYNGGSWTKTDKTNPTACIDCAYLETNCGCAILRQDELTGDRCQYWRSYLDKPSRREADMCSIKAQRGEYAIVHGQLYQYNGGSWTKVDITQRKEPLPIRRVEYFTKPPFMVGEYKFRTLGRALQCAWWADVDYIWIGGMYIDGDPKIGDIFEVHGKRWRLSRSERIAGERKDRYLLERINS